MGRGGSDASIPASSDASDGGLARRAMYWTGKAITAMGSKKSSARLGHERRMIST